MDTLAKRPLREEKAGASSSIPPKKAAITWRRIRCFVCHVDMESSPDLAVDMENYPVPLYIKIFNHFAKLLVIRDSQKQIVTLSEEKVKLVRFCERCHGQVLQLYRLSNSPNRDAEPTQKHILHLTNSLKFKFAFGKRNNSRLRNIITANADPTRYSINGYWHLRETEVECAQHLYRPKELNSILASIDISKLSASSGLEDESKYFLAPCELELEGDSFSGEDGDSDDNEDFDDEDNAGCVNPIDLVQVKMGYEVSNLDNQSQLDSAGARYDPMETQFFNVPVGEIKPPRKQILASRVGVSSQAPIIKTIMRSKPGEIKETAEPFNPRAPSKKTRDDETDGSVGNESDPDLGGDSDDEDAECPCPICNKKFPSRRTMIGHLYAHRKPFCDVCRQYFQDENIYKAHNASRHTGGPESCFICKISFKDRNKLVHHLRVHKHVNTYRCSVAGCTEAFKTKVDSIAHLRKCPFLGSISTMTIGSPTASSRSGDDEKSSEDDERPFTMEEVETEVDPGASKSGSEAETESEEGGVEMEEVEMEADEEED